MTAQPALDQRVTPSWGGAGSAALMGILNATPDSFSDGGRHLDVDAAVAAGRAMLRAGAARLDVGGESSRPGAEPVDVDEECRRVVPVIRGLVDACGRVPISIDTTKAAVAAEALDAGADMVNDISAGADAAMFPLVAERACELVLMHMRGEPRTMQRDPCYDDVVTEVIGFLRRQRDAACGVGVDAGRIWFDPGIGFGKTVAHNLALLRAVDRLRDELGGPVLYGVSRKSLLPKLTGVDTPAAERDHHSHLLHVYLAGRCDMLRVHDVAGARAACRLAACLGEEARRV